MMISDSTDDPFATPLHDALIAALRSDAYAHTRHRLRRDQTHFCATGVLCDIATRIYPERAAALSWHWVFLEEDYAFSEARGDLVNRHTFSMPVSIQTLFDQETLDHNGILTCTQLMALNDACVPFTRIADFLERDLADDVHLLIEDAYPNVLLHANGD